MKCKIQRGLKFFFLVQHLYLNASRIAFFKTKVPDQLNIRKPLYSNELVDIFKEKEIIEKRLPTLLELMQIVMKQKVLKYKIDSKEYEIYPLNKVIEIKGKEQKLLGYFDRISTSGQTLIMVYKNGDTSISGAKYSCIIGIEASNTKNIKNNFRRTPDIQTIYIQTNEFNISEITTNFSVLPRNHSSKSILSLILDRQEMDEKQEKSLASKLFKDLINELSFNSVKNGEILTKTNTLNSNHKILKKGLKHALELNKNEIKPQDAMNFQISKEVYKQNSFRRKLAAEKYVTKISQHDFNYQERLSTNEKLNKIFEKYFTKNQSAINSENKVKSQVQPYEVEKKNEEIINENEEDEACNKNDI